MDGGLPTHMPDLADTFGAAYVGASVTTVMYGITSLQTWFYFASYSHDTTWLKLMVFSLWIMDSVHTGLVSQAIYHYLVDNYGKPAALATGTTTLYGSIGLNVGIAIVCQCFFVGRIHSLCGPRTRHWLPALCALFTLLHFGFGMATVVKLAKLQEFQRLHEILAMPVTPFALSAVLSDVAIAGALCGLLWHTRTAFSDTNNLISQLILWAINRCLLTSVVAIAETIVFAVRPTTFWFLGVDFVIGKLYANSLLATLNARRALKGRSFDRSTGGTTSTSLQIATTVNSDMVFARPNARPVLDTEGSSAYNRSRNFAVDIELHNSGRSQMSGLDEEIK